MQESIPIPHTAISLFWWALATVLASIFGGGTLGIILVALLNRNKTKAEIHQTDAGTLRVLAEVRQIDTQTNIIAGDAVLRMVNQLAFVEARKVEIEAENERLSAENHAYEKQLEWARGMFKIKGIPWDDTKLV